MNEQMISTSQDLEKVKANSIISGALLLSKQPLPTPLEDITANQFCNAPSA